MFKISKTHLVAPYAIVAFELEKDGDADLGTNKGTYMELGVGPSWPLAKGRVTLTVPVKVGLSLNNYYEDSFGHDSTFGYIDVGGLLSFPFTKVSSQYGTWNIHAGVDFYGFGDTTKFVNEDKGSKVVWLGGIGLTY